MMRKEMAFAPSFRVQRLSSPGVGTAALNVSVLHLAVDFSPG